MISAPARRLSGKARTLWALQQVMLWAVLSVAGGVAVFSGFDTLGPLPLLVPLLGLVVGTVAVPRLRWARWRWDIGDEGIDVQHGTLTVRRTLVPWIRVQHVDTRHGIFEQAFDLATVVVHTAAGSHTIPLLDEAQAEQLRTRIAGLARTDEPPTADAAAPPSASPDATDGG
jgi:uncharacterized protein